MAETISVKRNVASNYVGNMYGMLISFIMAPVYLSYMGTEAYGLIGFFTMLSSWFQLLDMGLTPTIVRETALFRGGQISVGTLRVFLRGLEIIFGVISVMAAAVMLLLTPLIATRWLKVGDLPISDVEIAVGIMAAIVPIRWVSSLYRGIIVGFERMTWLAGYNIAIATLRFVGVLVVFFTLGANVKYFFAYQFVVSAVELAGVMILSHRFLAKAGGQREKFSWAPIKSNATFSLAIGFVSTAWVLLTQTDKLVLSKALPLAFFGVFSLAVAAAAVINIVGGPIGQALMPRMTKLLAEGRDKDVYRLYGDATQTVSVIVFPGVAALIFLAEPILRAWTGHPDVARHAAPILQLYAIGNGLSAFSTFAYYIQYARGNLRLHFIGNAIMLAFLLPAFVWAGARYGGVGTGAAWVAANVFYLLIWIPVVHSRFLPGRHWAWFTRDILVIGIPTLALCWLLSRIVVWPVERAMMFVYLGLIGMLLLGTAVAGSSFTRAILRRLARRYLPGLMSEVS